MYARRPPVVPSNAYSRIDALEILHQKHTPHQPLINPTLPPLPNLRRDTNHNNQTRRHERARHKRHKHNATPTRRELALDDPMLALKVPVIPDQQHDDGDGDEGRAKRLAHVPQRRLGGGRRRRGRGGRGRVDGRVEPEELGNGDADGSEGEGGAEPGQERSFWEQSAPPLSPPLSRNLKRGKLHEVLSIGAMSYENGNMGADTYQAPDGP